MKKFLSFLLTFAMLFSLVMPAMAAEPTITGGNEGEVSGTFNPEIAFTGFTYISDEIYTGETTFTAQAAYASYEGYESITGSFDPASKELAIGEKYTFTLELSGKPTKVLSGDKIGKVTITINEAAEG